MKVYEMIPGKLYQRGKIDSLPPNDLQDELRRLNIGLVVNLIARKDPEFPGIVLWEYPIADNKLPDSRWRTILPAGVTAYIRNNSHAALVHCNAGRNRSSLLTAMVLRQYYGITGEEAARRVQELRPNALANEIFLDYLKDLP